MYTLSLPELGDERGQATVLLFHFVDPVASDPGAKQQEVHGGVVQATVHPLGDVVDDAQLETDVAVEQQQRAQRGVDDGARRVKERVEGHGDQPKRHESLGVPVQRPVGLVGRRRHVGVVGVAHHPAGRLGDGLDPPGKHRPVHSRGSERSLCQSNAEHDGCSGGVNERGEW